MKMNENDLRKFAYDRFQNLLPVLKLWQTIAEHFYPERADFTLRQSPGDELGIGLASSQPVLIRRELGDAIGAMLRDGDWFKMGIEGEPDHMGRMWLEYATQRQAQHMNTRTANFRRATKEGDHDWAAFGNTVVSIELNKRASGLIYRCWHMRDCCWWDNDEGAVEGVIRKWNPKIHELQSYFQSEGDSLGTDVLQKIEKGKLFDTTEVYHFDISSKIYGHEEFMRYDYVSIFLDVKEEHIIRVSGKNYPTYIVPRFQTIAGSPIAYSPATVVGLPEARTLQAMTHTLLEAGERLARPPLIAVEKAIRGDANFFSDGITYISESFDPRGGRQPVYPLQQNLAGFPLGAEMRNGIIEVLQSAFYVNKINMPETTKEMTAYEVQERMKQYRRENLPLFAPVEHEYNGQLCEVTFNILMENGLLGSHMDIPESLREANVVFKFESPLSESEEEKKATTFSQVSQLLRDAFDYDQTVGMNINFDEAIRDAAVGVGAPAKWLNDVKEVEAKREQRAQQELMAMEAETSGATATG